MKTKKDKEKPAFKKGIVLVTAVAILSILLAVSLGISTIIISQIKTIRDMENSVQAYFAAETGIEYALYEIFVNKSTDSSFSGSFGKTIYYNVDKIIGNGVNNCSSGRSCIESTGTFRDTKRAIKVTI